MAVNNIRIIQPGQIATEADINQFYQALANGAMVPRVGGIPVSGQVDLGSPLYRFRRLFLEALDIAGFTVRTRDDSVFWNGVLGSTVGHPTQAGAEGFLIPQSNQRDIALAAGTICSARGSERTVSSSVLLPRPSGTNDPTDARFDLRRIGWLRNLFGYNHAYVHSALSPRASGSDVIHEYGVFYDVKRLTNPVTVAPCVGLYAQPAALPANTAGIADNDRLWSAADLTVYRKSGNAWVPTDEAFVGAVSYEANGTIRLIRCVRSRRFYDILTSIPFADFVTFANPRASNALTWASTISSNFFGVNGTALTLPTNGITPFFSDSGTGGSITSFGVGENNRFIGQTAANPRESEPLVTRSPSTAAVSNVRRLSLGTGGTTEVRSAAQSFVDQINASAGYRAGTINPDGIVSALYWNPAASSNPLAWARDSDTRTYGDYLRYPDPVLGMHPYLPIRALVFLIKVGFAFRPVSPADAVGSTPAQVVKRSEAISFLNLRTTFGAGVSNTAAFLPDGALDASAESDANIVASQQGNAFYFLRRPDFLLRSTLQPLLLPGTDTSDFGATVSRIAHRFGIDRNLP